MSQQVSSILATLSLACLISPLLSKEYFTLSLNLFCHSPWKWIKYLESLLEEVADISNQVPQWLCS